MLTLGLSLLAFQATSALCCMKEHLHERVFDPHLALAKRQERVFPPALEPNEAILLQSFDNATIESWNYYYTHGVRKARSFLRDLLTTAASYGGYQ
jgi:N-acetylated-alpha-linked acidic dipeptidase